MSWTFLDDISLRFCINKFERLSGFWNCWESKWSKRFTKTPIWGWFEFKSNSMVALQITYFVKKVNKSKENFKKTFKILTFEIFERNFWAEIEKCLLDNYIFKKSSKQIKSMFRCLQQTRQLSTTMVASKPKSDVTLVLIQSTVSEFKKQARRNRLGDKLETMDFDPFVQKRVLFKEVKKIKTLSVPAKTKYPEWLKYPTKVSYPKYFNVDDWFVHLKVIINVV